MLLTMKFVVLATLFVSTGGAVFTDWGRRHQILVLFAGLVAVIGSTYLFRDIYADFKNELRQELDKPAPSPQATAEARDKSLRPPATQSEVDAPKSEGPSNQRADTFDEIWRILRPKFSACVATNAQRCEDLDIPREHALIIQGCFEERRVDMCGSMLQKGLVEYFEDGNDRRLAIERTHQILAKGT